MGEDDKFGLHLKAMRSHGRFLSRKEAGSYRYQHDPSKASCREELEERGWRPKGQRGNCCDFGEGENQAHVETAALVMEKRMV